MLELIKQRGFSRSLLATWSSGLMMHKTLSNTGRVVPTSKVAALDIWKVCFLDGQLVCKWDSQRWGISLREAATELECVLCGVSFSLGLEKASGKESSPNSNSYADIGGKPTQWIWDQLSWKKRYFRKGAEQREWTGNTTGKRLCLQSLCLVNTSSTEGASVILYFIQFPLFQISCISRSTPIAV